MLDAVTAGYPRVPQAFPAVRMGGYFTLMAMCLVHNRLQFSERGCRIDKQFAISTERITRRRKYFDPIGAVMNLFANDLAGLFAPVNFLIPRRDGHIRSPNIVRI